MLSNTIRDQQATIYTMKKIFSLRESLKSCSLFLLLFSSLLLINHSLYAQGWDWQNPLPQGVNLFGVHFPNDSIGYTVGMDGTILKTTNGGEDWSAQSSGVGTTFESVFFPHPDTGYAVGYGNNTFHKTTNGGGVWVEVPEAAQSLTDVFFLNTNLGYAVGSNGFSATVVKTTNGGEDWEVQHTGTVTFYNAVYFVNDTVGWISGGGGRLLKTTNGGQTWITQTSGTSQTIESLYFHDELNGYGVSYGRIIKTTNGGATWTSTTIFQAFELYDIEFIDTSTGIAVGRSGIVLRTANGGASWSVIPTGTDIKLRSVSFMDALHGVAVGESGITLLTSDAGLTWVPFSTSAYYEDLNDAHFPADCTGFSVGDGGTILKTINGGATWVAQNSGFSTHLFGVHFTSEEVGYVVGNTGRISKTTDGGVTWNTQTSGLTVDLKDVVFTSADTGFVVGSGGYILKTTDGGTNWNLVTSNNTNNLTAIYFVDENLGFIVGSSGRVMKTIDGGTTWNILFSGTTLDLNSVYFPTPQIGYIAGVSGHIRKTINGGTNWTQQTNNINIALTSIAFLDENNGYVVGYDYNRYGKIYQTSNGGTTWSVETISLDHDLNAIKYADANTIYMVGNNGAILKRRMEATTASNGGSVCEGETIELSVAQVAGATYAWSGPNDFESTDQNPDIVNANILMDGVYTVLISLNSCTSASETTTVSVNAAPAMPSINYASQLCAGDQLSLSTNEVANASYTWSGPNGFTSTEQNPLVSAMATTTMSGTYALSITAYDCTSPAGEATIEIIAIPATPTIAQEGSWCEGEVASLATGDVEQASYLWIGPNDFSSTEQNPLLSENATTDLNGVYSLTTTVNGCSSLSAESAVLINPLPVTPVINHEGIVCEGATLSLSTENITGATYTWSGPNGFSSIDQNPLVSELADVLMSGTYLLTTTVNNCTSEVGEAWVQVIERPDAPMVSNNGPVCEGSAATLSATLVDNASYLWTGPNDFSSTDQNPMLSPESAVDMNGTYSVIAMVNGCSSMISETVVVINEVPLMPVILQVGTGCEGTALSLATSGVLSATYAWSGPDGFSSAEQNPVVGESSTVAMSGVYTLTITVNDCTSEMAEWNVDVQVNPEAPVASSNGPICEGDALILYTENIPDAIYSWAGPNGFTSTEQSPTVNASASPLMSGDYEVMVTVGNCSSTATSIAALVNIAPEAPTASSNGPVNEGTVLMLSATNVAGATYAWSGPNGFVSTEQNPTVSNEASMGMAGEYQVIVSVNGCESDAATVSVIVIPGDNLAETSSDFDVHIYPNPANTNFTIDGSGVTFNRIEIMNAIGEVIYHAPINQPKAEVQIDNLSAGIYMVVLTKEGRRVERKLMVY
jgi:photosystem II stability/assembly factor-like uncharacterized protein